MNKNAERQSVLMEVDLKEGTRGGHCFVMNEPCYTQYPEENELLLDDGIPFVVMGVRKHQDYEGIGKDLYVI